MFELLRPSAATCSEVIAPSSICLRPTALSLSRLPLTDLPMIWAEPTAPLAISFFVIAPFLMSFVDTVALPGRAIAAPDIATTSAVIATSSAGVGRIRLTLVIVIPSLRMDCAKGLEPGGRPGVAATGPRSGAPEERWDVDVVVGDGELAALAVADLADLAAPAALADLDRTAGERLATLEPGRDHRDPNVVAD